MLTRAGSAHPTGTSRGSAVAGDNSPHLYALTPTELVIGTVRVSERAVLFMCGSRHGIRAVLKKTATDETATT